MAVLANIVWKVDNLSSFELVGESTDSPDFTLSKKYSTDTKWRLILYPCGETHGTKDYASLSLWSLNDFDVVAGYCLKMYDENSKLLQEHSFERHCFNQTNRGCGVQGFLPTATLRNQNSIKIVCQIKIVDESRGDEFTINLDEKNTTEYRLRQNLWKLKCEKNLTDVAIKADDELLHCHKIVLTVGSKVFRPMLTNSDTYKSDGDIICSAFGFQCMEKLVEFLYVGHLDMNDTELSLVGELFSAADYYDLQNLKRLCRKQLMENVDLENVLQVLEIAWKTSCKLLQQRCISFMRINCKTISKREWKWIRKCDSNFAIYLMNQLINPVKSEIICFDADIKNNFLDSIWQLFLNDELSDVIIKCDGGMIKCHEVILLASSPQLHAVMKISSDSKTVSNFSFQCLTEMLQYLYTGRLEDSDVILELLSAGNEFGLSELKRHCEYLLLKKLDLDNAIDFLEAGWNGKCTKLRDKSLEMIISNPRTLCSEKYQNVVLKNFEFACFVSNVIGSKWNEATKSLNIILLHED